MNYNKRVTLITEVHVPGPLGGSVTKVPKVYPCTKTSASNDEQMGIWGKYNDDAFKLHIQGIHKNFDSIEFDGVERSVYRKKFHRNSTVVILT